MKCKHCKALMMNTPSGAICSAWCKDARIVTGLPRREVDRAWFEKWAMESLPQLTLDKEDRSLYRIAGSTEGYRKLGVVLSRQANAKNLGYFIEDGKCKVYRIAAVSSSLTSMK